MFIFATAMKRITSMFRKNVCALEAGPVCVSEGGGNFLFFSDLQINNNWIDRLLPVSGPAGVFFVYK